MYNDNPEFHLAKTRAALARDCSFSNDALGETQAIMFSVNRDSSALDRSNWRAIIRDLTAKFGSEDAIDRYGAYLDSPEDAPRSHWHIERFNHWAVGYLDYLIIDCFVDSFAPAPAKQLSEAFLFMCNALAALENYSVYDEDDYSALETDELSEYLESEIRMLRSDFTMRAPKSNARIAWKVRQHSLFDCVSSVDDMRGDILEDALMDLGYLSKRAVKERRARIERQRAVFWR